MLVCVNGLNVAANIVVTPFILEDYLNRVVQLHCQEGVPHPRSKNKISFLRENSSMFRILLKLHKSPVVLKVADGDKVALSAILNGSVVHGLDHYLIDRCM
jgi:hypothetical protein